MEPCINASPPKGEKTTNKCADTKTGESLPLSPKIQNEVGESSETPDNFRDASPKASLKLDSSSSQPASSATRVAQHHNNHHHHEKMPLDHSAASSRTRKPFRLSRLSSSVGSKQRRLRNKEFKQQQRRHSQPILDAEARHPEESTESSKPQNTSFEFSSPGKRRKGKQPIKFLRRALSSPPILLQRFHSQPLEKEWRDSSNHRRNKNPTRQLFRSSSNSSNSSCDLNLNVAERTRVVPEARSPSPKPNAPKLQSEEELKTDTAHCSATSILHHSCFPVLDTLCGSPQPDQNRGLSLSDYPRLNNFKNQIYNSACMSDDPTVQESIECIFASQLEDGLKLWDEDDDDGIVDDDDCGPPGLRSFASLEKVRSSSPKAETLVSPAGVHQSRMNRKDRKDSSKSLLFANMSQTKKRYEQASLVYVGTFDPSTPKNKLPTPGSSHQPQGSLLDDSCCHDTSTVYSNPLPCACHSSFLPSVEPKDWPQAPLALRPTPGKGTRVKAIRFSNSTEPLWVPGSHLTWYQRLEQHWGRQTEEELRKKRDLQPHYACCEECVLLPINNGNEKPGESLVTDFETDFFEGTLLLRIRHTEGTTPEPYDDNKGYFKGMNRRYQCCIRGRFKKALPFTQLTTGFRLDRQFGNLPSKWVIKSAMKVVRFFAPQLDIKMEGIDKPYSRAPLGSTPQCINVDEQEAEYHPKEISGCDSSSSSDEEKTPYVEDSNVQMNNIEGKLVESSEARRSILGIGADSDRTTPMQRAKMRKKAFDKLYAEKSLFPKTDPSKIYTFEFLQHLFNFQEFSIELGSMLGSIHLEDILDGQPLPLQANYGGEYPLWSFDIWNECLWERAQDYDAMERQKRAETSSSANATH